MSSGAVIDLIFALEGRAVAEDYADLLWQALRRELPWLEDDAAAGVHPLVGTSPGQGEWYLSRRSRLVLRLAADSAERALALCGAALDLGSPVTVGAASQRPLGETKVLYAHFVENGEADEVAFLAACRRLLDELGVGGEMVTGRPQRMRVGEREYRGFSLMLHDLKAVESLRLQHAGLGNQRKRGCGLFIQHKPVVSVGER